MLRLRKVDSIMPLESPTPPNLNDRCKARGDKGDGYLIADFATAQIGFHNHAVIRRTKARCALYRANDDRAWCLYEFSQVWADWAAWSTWQMDSVSILDQNLQFHRTLIWDQWKWWGSRSRCCHRQLRLVAFRVNPFDPTPIKSMFCVLDTLPHPAQCLRVCANWQQPTDWMGLIERWDCWIQRWFCPSFATVVTHIIYLRHASQAKYNYDMRHAILHLIMTLMPLATQRILSESG